MRSVAKLAPCLAAALVAVFLCALSAPGQNLYSPGVVRSPGTLTGVVVPLVSFSPAAGTYTGAQTVTVNCPTGLTCFYTTDGSTPNAASPQYTAPIAVSSTSTLRVFAQKVGALYQNTQYTNAHWKCVNVSGGISNGISCQSGGGVGSIQPSAWNWTWPGSGSSSPMVESLSTTASTSETQQLYIYTSPSGCGDCTSLDEDKIIQPSVGATYVANQEMDANTNSTLYNQFHTASLQCNQQSSNPGGPQWQIDNQQGNWQNTGITYGCPLSTTQQTEVRYGIHWANGDTSCGGYSCDRYTYLTVCVGGVCQDNTLNVTLAGYQEAGWPQSLVIQDQIDLTNTAQSGANPTTATRSVWMNNVTAGYYGTAVTGSASYTIH